MGSLLALAWECVTRVPALATRSPLTARGFLLLIFRLVLASVSLQSLPVPFSGSHTSPADLSAGACEHVTRALVCVWEGSRTCADILLAGAGERVTELDKLAIYMYMCACARAFMYIHI